MNQCYDLAPYKSTRQASRPPSKAKLMESSAFLCRGSSERFLHYEAVTYCKARKKTPLELSSFDIYQRLDIIMF